MKFNQVNKKSLVGLISLSVSGVLGASELDREKLIIEHIEPNNKNNDDIRHEIHQLPNYIALRYSSNQEDSGFTEGELFYNLTDRLQVDILIDGNFEESEHHGYEGESFVSYRIGNNYGIQSMIIHENEFVSSVGLGIYYDFVGENFHVRTSILPYHTKEIHNINPLLSFHGTYTIDLSSVKIPFTDRRINLGEYELTGHGGWNKDKEWTIGEASFLLGSQINDYARLSVGFDEKLENPHHNFIPEDRSGIIAQLLIRAPDNK